MKIFPKAKTGCLIQFYDRAMTDASKEIHEILPQDKLVLFEDKSIRRSFHKGDWYFSILDIAQVLPDTPNPRRYWLDLKRQLSENEGFIQLLGKIEQLKLVVADGKKISRRHSQYRNPLLHYSVHPFAQS